MGIQNIITGWTNLTLEVFNLLEPELQEMSKERIGICNDCPMRLGNTCNKRQKGVHVKTGEELYGCGCNLSAKTLDPDSECPLGKWDKFITNETKP